MLRAYGPGCDGSLVEASASIPEGATWGDDLRQLAQFKLLALKTKNQALPPGAMRENERYIAEFDAAYAAFIASQGT